MLVPSFRCSRPPITDAADADTGSGNVNDFAHVGEIGHTLVPVVCRNGNAVGNVCGARVEASEP